ncbi:Uncharacterised protein [Vibrio cholerae]|nr:Uncharacterised protein [Vibrio cholerae]CSB79857.1 Uncharacterised protein [Vibrio cholerae]
MEQQRIHHLGGNIVIIHIQCNGRRVTQGERKLLFQLLFLLLNTLYAAWNNDGQNDQQIPKRTQ